ncbi:MAG TPA: acetyltransferase, partial [Desulfurivibrionaceae bacterium]|nr:acetyltransferase [Desulfurivibrionaceae bacterium]
MRIVSSAFDLFNGDADGICALHQLRLHEPRPAQLVTGVKRDNTLLRHLDGVREAHITVLDISLDRNRDYLLPLLESCAVFYADHHFAGEIPASPNLTVHIDPSPEVCTSLIIDRLIGGRFRNWAVVGAFGDNLHEVAHRIAQDSELGAQEIANLRELGELLNYNGYGRSVADLFYHPAALYEEVRPFVDPLAFARESSVLAVLRKGYAGDMAKATSMAPLLDNEVGRVYAFPDAPWARRVAGVFSNEKAREQPSLAHAVLVDNGDTTTMV